MSIGLFAFIDFVENLPNHRRGCTAPVHFAADIAFVERSEGVLRSFRRQISTEPRRGAFLVFRSPLRRPRFAGNGDIVQTGGMGGPGWSIYGIDHSSAQLGQS